MTAPADWPHGPAIDALAQRLVAGDIGHDEAYAEAERLDGHDGRLALAGAALHYELAERREARR